jgi:hypothetical protein
MIGILRIAYRGEKFGSVSAGTRILSMLRSRLPLLAIAIAAMATVARAGEAAQPRDGLTVISAFLEEETILIAHVDLSRIDVGVALQ